MSKPESYEADKSCSLANLLHGSVSPSRRQEVHGYSNINVMQAFIADAAAWPCALTRSKSWQEQHPMQAHPGLYRAFAVKS